MPICWYGFLNGNKFLFRVFFWMEGDVRAWEQLPGFGCCGGGDVGVPLACTRGRCCETAFRQQKAHSHTHTETCQPLLGIPTHRDSGPYQWHEHIQSDTPNRKLVKTLRSVKISSRDVKHSGTLTGAATLFLKLAFDCQ